MIPGEEYCLGYYTNISVKSPVHNHHLTDKHRSSLMATTFKVNDHRESQGHIMLQIKQLWNCLKLRLGQQNQGLHATVFSTRMLTSPWVHFGFNDFIIFCFCNCNVKNLADSKSMHSVGYHVEPGDQEASRLNTEAQQTKGIVVHHVYLL